MAQSEEVDVMIEYFLLRVKGLAGEDIPDHCVAKIIEKITEHPWVEDIIKETAQDYRDRLRAESPWEWVDHFLDI